LTQTISVTPALLLAPAPLLAQQWKRMFDADKLLAPIIVTFGTGVFGWIAYLGEHTLRTMPDRKGCKTANADFLR